jgi:hypothetical protein
MSYLHALLISEFIGAWVLIACATVLALVFGVPTGGGGFWFMYTLIIGALPVLAFGAPIYAMLVSRGRSNVLSAALLGLIPGIGLALWQPILAPFAIGTSLVAAIATHGLVELYRK